MIEGLYRFDVKFCVACTDEILYERVYEKEKRKREYVCLSV